MYKTLQNVNFVQFVTNFTKIKFLKKCKKVKMVPNVQDEHMAQNVTKNGKGQKSKIWVSSRIDLC